MTSQSLRPGDPETRTDHNLIPTGNHSAVLLGALFILFAIVLIRTAWVCDDAYISFRVVDNFVQGEGLRWNIAERVQAFTNPLWVLVMSAFYAITHDMYYTSIAVSIALTLASLFILVRWVARSNREAVLGVLLLLFSRAFIDYSTSGLENVLSHAILVVFMAVYAVRTLDVRTFFWLCLIASLAVVNRMDTILLYLPALVLVFWRLPKKPAMLAGVVGFLPIILWELFALVYFGFPFPNTYFAKLHAGIPAIELFEQGFVYYLHIISTDPLTLITILVACFVSFRVKNREQIAMAIGVVLYLLYILRIGGDFMGGRFFALPFLASVALLMRVKFLTVRTGVVAAIMVCALGLIPNTPTVLSGRTCGENGAPGIGDTGIVDERAWYYRYTGLLRKNRKSTMPAHPWMAQGLQNRLEETAVKTASVIGFEGFASGPDVFIVDGYALTDPLLARLPTCRLRDWRVGHLSRVMPAGYLKTLISGENKVADSGVAAYWDRLVSITRAPIFSTDRFVDIIKMNLGMYDGLIHDYTNPPSLHMHYADVCTPKAAGSPWNADGCVEIRYSGVEILLDSTYKSKDIEISVDHNDYYQLVLYLDSIEVGSMIINKSRTHGGLRVDTLRAPESALWGGYNRLWLYAERGDDMYSVGHVRILTSE